MRNKLLSVMFVLLALVLLVGCEKKTQPQTKKQGNDSSQVVGGGSQTQKGEVTTKKPANTQVLVINQAAIGTVEGDKAGYSDHNVTIGGVGIYSHSIIRNGYCQMRIAKSGKTASVLMNTTALKKVVSVEVKVVFDSDGNNKTPTDGVYGKIVIYGFNEAIENNEKFATANIASLETIQIVAGTTTYTYTFTGDFKFFAVKPETRMLPVAEVKVVYEA